MNINTNTKSEFIQVFALHGYTSAEASVHDSACDVYTLKKEHLPIGAFADEGFIEFVEMLTFPATSPEATSAVTNSALA